MPTPLKAASLSVPEPDLDLGLLRLGDACALLAHGGVPANQLPGESSAAYLQRVLDALCELSLRDPLTGLANRRHFMSALRREIASVARSGDSTLLLMLDIDLFKKVNDTYGHPVGDKVLQVVAEALGGCVRPKDTVVRYGGEEFAVILPDCHVTYGLVVAERMRETIQSLDIAVSPSLSLNITVSIGGAYAPNDASADPAEWIARADRELYKAKDAGRNRVSIDQPLLMAVSPEEKSQLFIDFSQNDSIWGSSLFGAAPGADSMAVGKPATDATEAAALRAATDSLEQSTPR
jgi:two-component system, cell cycle response regulator